MKVLWAIDEYMLDHRTVVGDMIQAVQDSGHDLFLTKYVPLGNYEDQSYPENKPGQPVILYGTIGWISKSKMPYYPGVFAFGDETNANRYMTSPYNFYMLNRNYIMLPFKDIRDRTSFVFDLFGDHIFIRPNTGKKAFAGTTFTADNFEHELRSIKDLQHAPDEEICLIAPAQKLKAEYRTIIGNKEVLAYSQYRRDDILDIRRDISEEALKFAEMIAGLDHQLDLIYTLDIAELPDGECRIIEFNSFNSSGLYAMDRLNVVNRVSDIVIKDFKGEL